jgi:hypothetical protein
MADAVATATKWLANRDVRSGRGKDRARRARGACQRTVSVVHRGLPETSAIVTYIMNVVKFTDTHGNSVNVTYDGDLLVADPSTSVAVVLDPNDEIVVYNAAEQSTRVMDDAVQLNHHLTGGAYQAALGKLTDLRALRNTAAE